MNVNVVVTGSRDWQIDKAPIIWNALESLQESHELDWTLPVFTLHHGACPYGGADLIAASWAHGAGWAVVPHPPIKQEGWAYAKRNQEMVDLNPTYVVAFFLEGAGNRGTTLTYNMAKDAGLNIIEVRG